jgi:hypothetical protein
MARRAVVALAAVLAIAVIPVVAYLAKPREVVSSTPSSFTGATVPLPLPAHGRVCADELLFDTDSEVARFGATAPRTGPAPELEVVGRGNTTGPYRNAYSSRTTVSGGWTGTRTLNVRLRPPGNAVFGTLCIRNTSGRAMALVGQQQGRANSRPTITVNGSVTSIELPLRFLARGKQSLLARTPQVFAHASTLRPFGTWWWWVLSFAVIGLAPLGIAAAMRSALVAGDGVVAPDAAPRTDPFPSERVRARFEEIPGWALLAGAAAIAFAWLAYWGAHTHSFQADEDQYVYLSRWFPQHLPESIWNFDVYQRGLQRFEIWLLAIPALVLDSPWSLATARVLNALAFVSTAIPVYLLGRGMRLSPRWAALPAALSVVVPWAVVTTSFLAENLAFPASLWAIWAIWRTTAAPSARRDLLALVLLLVCGLCRTGMLLLAPALPVAVLLTDARFGEGSVAARLRRSLATHAVMWAAVGLSALVLVVSALGIGPSGGVAARLAGGYGTPFGFDVVTFTDKIAHFVSRVVLGTAFLPAAVALPWLATQLVRPGDRRRYAYAVTVTAVSAAILYSLGSAGFDERYIVYFGPLVFLTATLALANREISAVGLAIASVLLAVLLLRVPWSVDPNPYAFFVSPVETFFARGVAQRLDPYLPGGPGTVVTLVPIAAGLVGVGLAVVLRRAPERLAGAVGPGIVAVVALAVLVQTHYTLTKFVNGAGNGSGPGLRDRAWVDQLTPAEASLGVFGEGVGGTPGFFPIWQELQFYNQRVDTVYTLGSAVAPVPVGDKYVGGVSFDPRTGRVQSSRPLPDYLAIPLQIGTARVRGTLVKAQTYMPVGLIKVAKPATMSWSAQGIANDGTVPRKGATIRVYGTGLTAGRHCVTFDFLGATDRGSRWRIVDGRRSAGAGSLAPAQLAHSTYRIPDLVGRGSVDLDIRGTGGPRLLGVTVDARRC